jgi:hypothetical protein
MFSRWGLVVGIGLLLLAGLPGLARAQTQTGVGVQTKITVRVIAQGGKFLGDDVGGAQITIRDLDSGAVLATGFTHGGSGPDTLVTQPIARSRPFPIPGDAGVFNVAVVELQKNAGNLGFAQSSVIFLKP